jgi:hypothetical protein
MKPYRTETARAIGTVRWFAAGSPARPFSALACWTPRGHHGAAQRGVGHSNSRSSRTNCSSGSGTVNVFTKLHLGHSKMRFSLRSGLGDTRTNIMRVWQREQLGRSMGIRDEGMVMAVDKTILYRFIQTRSSCDASQIWVRRKMRLRSWID